MTSTDAEQAKAADEGTGSDAVDRADPTDGKQVTETPEPDQEALDSAKEEAKQLEDKYEPDARKSVVLPGTDGTVSGTAIADWLDDKGEIIPPEDRENATEEDKKAAAESDDKTSD
ncbi:hypothetical protein [Antrihabitans spumae]|jgi:hypothetical protein|uniref:Uncharacterized protein n=1 Tax=Antrihabitans spumae TaxID=3373370 RepID=A0ABW7JMG4_9NOCA